MNSNDFTTAEIEQILSLYKSQKIKNKERYEGNERMIIIIKTNQCIVKGIKMIRI